LRLLDLQAADTNLSQLAHRRATLPESVALAQLEERAAALHNALVDVQTQRDDVAAEQRRLENEVETVRNRASRDEARLATGGLPSKELESLQHEVTSLARRQSSLEDDLLDVMERREVMDGEVATLTGEQQALDADRELTQGKRDDALAALATASAQATETRASVAAGLPADLITLYERVRASSGGVGAAMLRQRRCEGCRIELAGNELSAMRSAAPDEVMRCENCRRILVRTGESGL
jgi:predicted  nucleic acid-binding Zn-ribbon protein